MGTSTHRHIHTYRHTDNTHWLTQRTRRSRPPARSTRRVALTARSALGAYCRTLHAITTSSSSFGTCARSAAPQVDREEVGCERVHAHTGEVGVVPRGANARGAAHQCCPASPGERCVRRWGTWLEGLEGERRPRIGPSTAASLGCPVEVARGVKMGGGDG